MKNDQGVYYASDDVKWCFASHLPTYFSRSDIPKDREAFLREMDKIQVDLLKLYHFNGGVWAATEDGRRAKWTVELLEARLVPKQALPAEGAS